MGRWRDLLQQGASGERIRKYVEIEYAHFDGSTYIDTGYIPNGDTVLDFRLRYSVTGKRFFGIRTHDSIQAGDNNWQLTCPSNNKLRVNVGHVDNTGHSAGAMSLNNWYRFNVSNGTATRSVFTTLYTWTPNPASFTCPRSAYLGASNVPTYDPNYNLVGDISYCRIYEGATLVMNLIPALSLESGHENEICFYDKVSKRCIYPARGALSAPTPLREIHKVIEYLESDGTNYLDVKTTPYNRNTYHLDTTFTTPSSSGSILGSFGSGGTNGTVAYSADNTALSFKFKSTLQDVAIVPIGNKVRFVADCDIVNNTVSGTVSDLTSGIDTPFSFSVSGGLSNVNVAIFGQQNGGSSTYDRLVPCKFYSFRDLLNGIEFRDCVPAIDQYGKGFMLDESSHVILDSGGTNDLKFPDVELEYLQSDGDEWINLGYSLEFLSFPHTYVLDITATVPESPDDINKAIIGAGDIDNESCTLMTDSNGELHCYFYNNSENLNILSLTGLAGHKCNFNLDANIVDEDTIATCDITVSDYTDNEIYTTSVGSLPFNSALTGRTMLLFGRNGNSYGNKSSIKVYDVKATIDGTLMFDGVPMIVGNRFCIWDKVAETDHFNGDVGSLIGRPKDF